MLTVNHPPDERSYHRQQIIRMERQTRHVRSFRDARKRIHDIESRTTWRWHEACFEHHRPFLWTTSDQTNWLIQMILSHLDPKDDFNSASEEYVYRSIRRFAGRCRSASYVSSEETCSVKCWDIFVKTKAGQAIEDDELLFPIQVESGCHPHELVLLRCGWSIDSIRPETRLAPVYTVPVIQFGPKF